MMIENTKLAPGLCFRPDDEELIGFLKQKAEGKKMSTVFVAERNLYCGEPWNVLFDINKDLWTLHDESSRKKKMVYVVTEVSKNADRNTTKRMAGHGTWDGQTQLYPLENKHGMIIGHRKMLTYTLNPDHGHSAVGRGYWYLHEITLSKESLREIGLQSTDYVMCRIIWDMSKTCQVNGKKLGKKFKKTALTRDQEIRVQQHGEIENAYASEMAQQQSLDHPYVDKFSGIFCKPYNGVVQQVISLPEQIYGGSNIPQELFHQEDGYQHGEIGQASEMAQQQIFDHPNVIENHSVNDLSEILLEEGAVQLDFSFPQEDYQRDFSVEDYMAENEIHQNSFGGQNVVQSGFHQIGTTPSQENEQLGESNQHALPDDPFQDIYANLLDENYFNISEMLGVSIEWDSK